MFETEKNPLERSNASNVALTASTARRRWISTFSVRSMTSRTSSAGQASGSGAPASAAAADHTMRSTAIPSLDPGVDVGMPDPQLVAVPPPIGEDDEAIA